MKIIILTLLGALAAAHAQCIAQGQNAAVYVADGTSPVRIFSTRATPPAEPIYLNLNPAPAFAGDPVACVAYGSVLPPATRLLPKAAPRIRESLESAVRCQGSTCPPDSGRRLWVVTRSGKIYREDDSDGLDASMVNRQMTMTMNMTPVAGAAVSIKAGADGSIWAIGTDAAPGGHSIYKWMGSSWNRSPANGINAGVAPSGAAWVIDSEGTLKRFDGVAWRSVATQGPVKDVAWDTSLDLPNYYAAPSDPGSGTAMTLWRLIGLDASGTALVKGTTPAMFKAAAIWFSPAGDLWSLQGTQLTVRLRNPPAGTSPGNRLDVIFTEDGGFTN